MKRKNTEWLKRLTACLLSAALCVAVSWSALAAEGENAAPESSGLVDETVSSESSQPPQDAADESSGEVSDPEISFPDDPDGDSGEEADGDSSEGESSEGEASEGEELESAEHDVPNLMQAEASLLVLGGHNYYLNGYTDGLFRPGQVMTRREVCRMLYNLLADKSPSSGVAFRDVTDDGWSYEPINKLAGLGVLHGYGDGIFLPDNPITRAEFVQMLSKCVPSTVETGGVSFTDVIEGEHWAYKAITKAAANKWISGMGDGTFEPDRGIKRCEVVSVMNRALGRQVPDVAGSGNAVRIFADVPVDEWYYNAVCEAVKPPANVPATAGGFTVGKTVRVTAGSGLNLRETPSTSGRLIVSLLYHTVIKVTDVSKLPWLGVETDYGKGYVHSDYVENYEVGAPSGAALSASSLSVRQYQSARLDASVTEGLEKMKWTSSNPSVAVVGYTLNYNSKEEGAMVYAKSPGTTTLTFADEGGNTKASCTVTVTGAEAVRYAYASENTAAKGVSFDLIAVTDTGKSSVKFEVTGGPAHQGSNWTTSTSSNESRTSQRGLPVNNVKVFRQTVSFGTAGTYTVKATSNGSSEGKTFTVLVRAAAESATTVSDGERRASNAGLDLIANFEGKIPECYDDPIARKNPTVGYGYVVSRNTTFYNNLTDSELRALLAEKVNSIYGAAVERFRKQNGIKMSQAQFDALTSLVYNNGTGVLSEGTYDTPKVMLNAVVPPADMSASKPYTGTLNVTSDSIYEKADVSSKKLKKIDWNGTVQVIGFNRIADKQQVWYQVKSGNVTGWMPAGSVKLSASNLSRDFTYVDSTILATNFLSWNKAGGVVEGLVLRRNAECKVFFFGNYAEASHSSALYAYNTYGFIYPSDCAGFDYRR